MGDKAQEFDNSLNDFIERVRAAFAKRFPSTGYSDGDGYVWVTDVFQDKVVAKQGDKYYEVSMTVTGDSVTFAEQKDWVLVRLSYITELLGRARRHDTMIVFEFKGKYPDVPFAPGIDIDALIEGDDSPVFVTLPVGKANSSSGNSRFYDEKFVTELEKQVISKKPIGLMGHLSEEARKSEFPIEAVHWLGAKRVGELLWAKGYCPPGEARSRLKRYKSTGKQIATSIDAWIDGVWDAEIKAYRMKADTLDLNQIDIGPADRAGIKDLAMIPHLTTEMADVPPIIQEQQDMNKTEAIQSLTPDDVQLLPASVRQAVIAAAGAGNDAQLVTELRSTLGVDATADLVKKVQELRQAEAQRVKDAITGRIRELVEDAEKGVKLTALRGLVVEMVRSRNPQTTAEAEAIFADVMASEAVGTALAGHVQTTMGPRQGAGSVAGQNGAAKYFKLPEPA